MYLDLGVDITGRLDDRWWGFCCKKQVKLGQIILTVLRVRMGLIVVDISTIPDADFVLARSKTGVNCLRLR